MSRLKELAERVGKAVIEGNLSHLACSACDMTSHGPHDSLALIEHALHDHVGGADILAVTQAVVVTSQELRLIGKQPALTEAEEKWRERRRLDIRGK